VAEETTAGLPPDTALALQTGMTLIAWGSAQLRVITTTRLLRPLLWSTLAPRHGDYHHCDAGTVTHKDSMGNLRSVPAGDVQTMSAGTGVTHSEVNADTEVPLSLFQIG